MAKTTKAPVSKEDLVEKILDLGVPRELETHILTQDFIVAQLRMIADPTDDEMVEIQNNVQLLEHMNTEEYADNFKQIFREEYLTLDKESLNFVYQALSVTNKIKQVESKSHRRIEDMINNLDFLVEVEGKEKIDSSSKVLH